MMNKKKRFQLLDKDMTNRDIAFVFAGVFQIAVFLYEAIRNPTTFNLLFLLLMSVLHIGIFYLDGWFRVRRGEEKVKNETDDSVRLYRLEDQSAIDDEDAYKSAVSLNRLEDRS